MAFGILRIEKLKSAAAIVGRVKHNTRETATAQVDSRRTHFNAVLGGSSDEVMKNYHDLLPEKKRKDAVLAFELVLTASPEFLNSASVDDQKKFAKACSEWAKEKFGKENLLSMAAHMDESTPHVHAVFMPLKDGRLNAKHWLGGPEKMKNLQDDFFQNVCHQFGLERGVSREVTKSRHVHFVKGAAAAFDEKEKLLRERENKIEEAKESVKKIADNLKISPAEIQALKNYRANWEKTTAAGLKVIARDIEQSGCATVGEYSQLRENQRRQTQNRKL